MNGEDIKAIALRLRVLIEEVMQVSETIIGRYYISFRGTVIPPAGRAFSWMKENLGRLGYVPLLRREGNQYEVRVIPAVSLKPSNPLINVILFLLTVGSTLFVGAQMEGADIVSDPRAITAGVPFAATIIAILLVHEFGHYLMSKFHCVLATLPYFIPAPTIIGTLGAVIKTKSPIPDRRSLLDIGAAGPICGFAVATVALGFGLSLSRVVELEPALRAGVIQFGDSLITAFMTYIIKGPLPPAKTVMLHPIAFAGWVGLLVTAFNLMPVGQLDGGHVVYALIGRWHSIVAKITIGALVVMGFAWEGWFIWAFLVLILGPHHAPPLNDVTPLNRGRRLVGAAAVAIFILCLVPVPVRFASNP